LALLFSLLTALATALWGVSRDAADVAISNTFGPNTLLSFKVWTDEISSVGTP
jgi:hypothetical protein